MRILVYGAGVLGSLYAARLAESGQDVTILARGQRLADLRAHGIVLEDRNTGRQSAVRVDVVEQLRPEDAYDWVLVLMRKNQVPQILPALAANRHTPNVLFMVNNAAGPGAYVEALGRARVLLGFPGAGGVRAGHVIRFIAGSGRRRAKTTIGELNGTVTPRLEQIRRALEGAGFPVVFSPNMDAWLKTHVALVSPIANALYMAGGDNYRLARTRDGLVLLIRAVREGVRVLRALDVPVTPPALQRLTWLPEPVLMLFLRRLLDSEAAEIALAAHANAARDEMGHLAGEFRTLARSTNVPTPAMDRLYTYVDPAVPPVHEGSRQIGLDWSVLWIGLGLLAGLGLTWATWALLRRRRR